MDNLIKLKELQVVCEALKKRGGDEGFKTFFSFSKGGFFYFEKGRMGVIPSLSKDVFF